MSSREFRVLCRLIAAGAALFIGVCLAKGHVHLGAFWRQHGDAVAMGCALFVAFLVLLAVYGRVSRKRLLRARAQRDRAERQLLVEWASADRADDADAYRPRWTYGVPERWLRDEFEGIVRREFTGGGEPR